MSNGSVRNHRMRESSNRWYRSEICVVNVVNQQLSQLLAIYRISHARLSDFFLIAFAYVWIIRYICEQNCLFFADKSWSLSRQSRQAGTTSERKVSLRIAMVSDFVSPMSFPQSRILFQFLERRKKGGTYVRTYARRRTINVTGRALRNQRRR